MLHHIVYNGLSGYMLVDIEHNPFEKPCVPEPGPQPKDFLQQNKKPVRKGFGMKVRDSVAGLFVSKPAKAIDRCQGDF
jgi:hypothetical protein